MRNSSFTRQLCPPCGRGGRDSPSLMDAGIAAPTRAVPLPGTCAPSSFAHRCWAWSGAVPGTSCTPCTVPSPESEDWDLSPRSMPGHHFPLGLASGQTSVSIAPCAHRALCTEISFKDSLGGGKQPGHRLDVSFNPFAVRPVHAPSSCGKRMAVMLSLCPCSPSAGDRGPGEGAGPAEAAGHLG